MSSSARSILVTGGAGFLGSALVRRLLAGGYEVRVLDDFSRGRPRRLEDLAGITTVSGDVRDESVVDKAVRGVDAICHLAAINGTRWFYERPFDVLEVGIQGTLNVLRAAERHGVARIQLFSSSEVYHHPDRIPTPEDERAVIPDVLNPRYSYAGSKLAGELLVVNFCRDRALRWQVIRPHNVYGPDMGDEHVIPNLVRRISELRDDAGHVAALPIQGGGSETRAYCYVTDAVEGTVIALESDAWDQHFHLGTPVETSVLSLVSAIAQVMGVTIGRIEPGPLAPGGTDRRCPDISRLQSLGYEPKVALLDGLRLTVPWYEDYS